MNHVQTNLRLYVGDMAYLCEDKPKYMIAVNNPQILRKLTRMTLSRPQRLKACC